MSNFDPTHHLADVAVVGLGTMGKNLALNSEDRGLSVALWNLDSAATQGLISEGPNRRWIATASLSELVARTRRPRRILLMITAGRPVDDVVGQLAAHLEPGDVVVDGGNSRPSDTDRREETCRAAGFRFVGMGVSGGEEGARHGPSLMPGGAPEAYEVLGPWLTAIAAQSDRGPCVTHVGPGGSGHFVKMVHNGIEYADMQLLAEAYDLLRRGAGYGPAEIQDVFQRWSVGPLRSFLLDVTLQVVKAQDAAGALLVESIEDRAGQKGTGRWTVESALEFGVAVPSLAAAVDARILSSQKALRQELGARWTSGAERRVSPQDRARFEQGLHDALYGAKIAAWSQGFELIGAASHAKGWGIDRAEVARIWRAGCIIRSAMLDLVGRAFEQNPELPTLIGDGTLGSLAYETCAPWQRVIAMAAELGIPIPTLSAGWNWIEARRSPRLPQNLTQAQRDAFGAHGFHWVGEPVDAPLRHHRWS